MSHKVISLFAGAGGMDFGAHKEGFDTVFALDNFEASTETFRKYFPSADVKCSGIFEFNDSKKNPYPKADIVMGGYPCQSFSMGGVRAQIKMTGLIFFLVLLLLLIKLNPKFLLLKMYLD